MNVPVTVCPWIGVSHSQVAGCDCVVLVAMPLIPGHADVRSALDHEVMVDRLAQRPVRG